MKKHKTIIYLSICLILGLLLRLWCIDKPEGLWNDEYIGWFIASKHSLKTFISEILKNCHMPAYYIYLKFWMKFFGDTDLSLRLSSVAAGIPAIFMMYKVGKEHKNEELGIFCAYFCAISSFLIYFSQEVRLYSMLFLFSTIYLYYWIKTAKIQSKLNYIMLCLAGSLILFTHTIGFVFIFFSTTALIIYLKNSDSFSKKRIIIFSATTLLLTLLLSPFIIKIFTSGYESQFWGSFSIQNLYFVLSDYFSAFQINLITAPKAINDVLFTGNSFNFMFFIFGMIPTLTAIFFIIKSLFEKERIIKYLAGISFLTIFVLTITSILGKLVFATKYSIEIYPILILLMGIGILSTSKNIIKKSAIFILIFLPLFHYIINRNSIPKLGRIEGNKQVITMLKSAEIKPNDLVILTYYNENKFKKYYNDEDYNIIAIDKYGYPAFILKDYETKDFKDQFNKKDYKKIFINSDYSTLKRNLDLTTFKTIKNGDHIAVVILKNVSFFSEKDIKKIAENEKEYNKTPLTFLSFSYIKNGLIDICKKEFQPEQIYRSGDWVLVVFKKV